MKFKKIILITLFLLTIFTIGSVSANENVTDGISTEQNTNELETTESNLESLSITSDTELNQTSENDLLKINTEDSNKLNTYFNDENLSSSKSYPEVDEIVFLYDEVVWNNEDVKLYDVQLKDSNKKIIYGYVDIYVDGKYYKKMNINHNKETLNLGKFKIGKHTILVEANGDLSTTIKISVIKNPNYKESPSKTTVKAPIVTAYYKANKYFKVSIKKNRKAVKNLKLNLKVYTGGKYKNYVIKTNKNGVAKISTKKFKVGSHKVKITSKNNKYKVSKTSKIVIKKKSTSKYIIITTTAKMYNIVKKSGNFAVKTYIDDFTAGVRAPYKCIDIFLYKNGKQVKNTKYYTNYRIDGQWTGWVQYGLISTAHHRYLVEDNANVEQIKVKVNKNVNSFY